MDLDNEIVVSSTTLGAGVWLSRELTLIINEQIINKVNLFFLRMEIPAIYLGERYVSSQAVH